MPDTCDTARRIGSFLDFETDTFSGGAAGVEPLAGFPGWVRVVNGATATLLQAAAVIAVRLDPDADDAPCLLLQGGGALPLPATDAEPEAVLRALRPAAPAPQGRALPLHDPALPAGDLLVAVQARRAGFARMFPADEEPDDACNQTLARRLGVVRDHARLLAQRSTHPRDLLLLLRDFCHEAAAAAHDTEAVEDSAAFLVLARQLERDAARLPTGGPAA